MLDERNWGATERVYFLSDDLQEEARVIDCIEYDGRFATILDRTIFHPKGGGQPADIGWIDRARVLDVVDNRDTIFHIVDRPISPTHVGLHVDRSTRIHHTLLHSAGHLIGCAGEKMGFMPCRAHHWPGECTITFEQKVDSYEPKLIAERALSELSDLLRVYIEKNMPRSIRISGSRRWVGFGDLPEYPCGGTHAPLTAMLESIAVKKVKIKNNKLLVSYG